MGEFIKSLMEKRSELEQRIQRISKHAGVPLDNDSREASIELQNDEVLQGLDDEARMELRAIKRALLRIERGVYYSCARCSEPIPKERLEANPFSEFCIECAREDLLAN